MALSNNCWIKHTRSGIQRIYSWINTQFCNLTRQNSCCIKMRKSCCWGWICKIISRHINSLDRSNRTSVCGSNTFLKFSQICSQGWLVTDSRWNSSQKSRHFRTCLSKSENIINKQKHILSLRVTEIFCNSQSGQSNSSTSTRRFVHLTVNQSGLGSRFSNFDNSRFNHFVVQIISFTGTFTNTSKNRETTMSTSNITDKFHNQNCFTDTSSTKKTNFSSSCIRSQKIDNLNSCDQHRSFSGLFCKCWRCVVDW
mmetsp:Transcript_21603/g.27489  ORF Transcript_21603/g.27489 Transcript_21603/m.27489 type:complete len:254 (-) Transcript_21603:657-1418(-)